ncbi:MAG: TetR/AcrR family transcriptional regulator [Anaerolineales bacterium]|nr:TetR/AcrR family transcriptional regulator [Anaerolineales bacterium]
MQTRSIETRAKIIQAAQDLFSQTGYESASVSEICTRAGISKGAFYHHFPSKQSVFLELLTGWLKGIDLGLEALRSSPPGPDQPLVRMAEILPEVIRAAEGRLPILLEFWVHSARNKELWDTAVAPYQRYRDYFRKIVSEMDPAGELDPARKETAALAVMSLSIGLLLQGVVDPKAADWGTAGRESIRMLLEGMTRRSS